MIARSPFLVPELLESILDDIVPGPYVDLGKEHEIRLTEGIDYRARRALLALAQTCRATSKPALDRLWRVLYSLVPLFQTFSKVLPVVEDADIFEPSPADWVTIHWYDVRVRELCIIDDDDPGRSLKCFRSATALSVSPRPLFPNLKVLIWNMDVVPLDGLKPFLTPTLVSLDIGSERDMRNTYLYPPCDIVELISFACPTLKAFRWGASVSLRSANLPVNVETSFSFLQKIEHLELERVLINPSIFGRVIRSQNFKTLCINASREVPIAPEDILFPNVETLRLETKNLEFITSFLRPHRQTFRGVSFQVDTLCPPSSRSMYSCFHALATPQRTKSLRSLDFILPNADPYFLIERSHVLQTDYVCHSVTYEALSPLMSFSFLRRLVIELGAPLYLDDGEFKCLVRCWPSMEILLLKCKLEWGLRDYYPKKWPTLHGMLVLFSACPRLREVGMNVDARDVPTDVSPDIYKTNVEEVLIYNYLVDDENRLYEFVEKLYPWIVLSFYESCNFSGNNRAFPSDGW